MNIKGKTLTISAPNLIGALTGYRKWTLTFKCGSCGANSTVQHDEINNYHKCSVCKQINILDKTSWYDL